MEKYTQIRKELVIGLIALFLSMPIIPITGSLPIEKEHSIMTKGCSDGIILNGTMGNNGWYISPVTITFYNENGSWVHCFLRIDSGDWFEYTGPIVVDTEGAHGVYWYYIDQYGNQSSIYSVFFKIDMTPPTVTIIVHRIGLFEIGVSVYASDNTSGVVLVEIYRDGSLVGNITVEPFEFIIMIGLGEHTVKVIVYDAAGLNGSASVSTSYDLCHIQSRLLHQQILRVFQILLYQQILVEQIQN
jgi:hypothetical protein